MYVARFESAIEDFEAIIGIEPDNAAARAARGLAREVLGKRGGAVAPQRGRERRVRFAPPPAPSPACRRRAMI